MNNKAFLIGLKRRGIKFSIFNNTVQWSGGTLSKIEARRLRRLRHPVAAMRAIDSAGPDVTAGVDARFDVSPVTHWSWKPPRRPDPGKTIYSRSKCKANRKRRGKPVLQPIDGLPTPLGERQWERTLGREFQRLMDDTP